MKLTQAIKSVELSGNTDQLLLINPRDGIMMQTERLTITVINYSSRASELGSIVSLADRRRSSLLRSERPPLSS